MLTNTYDIKENQLIKTIQTSSLNETILSVIKNYGAFIIE
jgi:hypothetical protein